MSTHLILSVYAILLTCVQSFSLSAINVVSNNNIPFTLSVNQRPRITTTPPSSVIQTYTKLQLSTNSNNDSDNKKKLPVFLDPGTKGGVTFLSILLFVLPLVAVNVASTTFGLDEVEVGRWTGALFTLILSLLWASTYVFRVATKDMTYAKQLKDYEDAVIAKRLEELDEDEVQALVEEIERDTSF